MPLKRYFIKVEGIVQGVGFRPFIYNLAVDSKLNGWVNNNSEGVYIDIEGDEENITKFLYRLKSAPPPLSKIENIYSEEKNLINYKEFTIKKSEKLSESITLISPDIAICNDCISDITNSENRRYRYPFTNCTNCGPRFSIIKEIPYDRDKTTMKKFKMCPPCESEYTTPSNRRFHAQPNACESCGPHIFVCDSSGNELSLGTDIIKWCAEKLKEGKIFAIKGLTGFHLVCDAKNEAAVNTLRLRKRRPHKPFAVMAKNVNITKEYCLVNETEEKLLTGFRKPIVILDRKENYNLPEIVAPGQNTLGVMLPYTPLHYLLFQEDIDILIMTSANVYGLPLEYNNISAVHNLSNLVDYFLMHDRDIFIPVDDSVTRVTAGEMRMIRRARGYVPEPIKIKGTAPIIAYGPNMKNTFCISKDDFLFLSQHNGDLQNLQTIEHFNRNIKHFKKIFLAEPKYAVCDLHPSYSSTDIAKESKLPLLRVQHHHAHIVSCMAENKISKEVIGVAFDGTGYGTDGTVWGGEFLVCTYGNFKRAAHLDYFSLPGGEKAIKEPWRIAAALLYNTFPEVSMTEKKAMASFYLGNKASDFLDIVATGINCIQTSSMGRLFDAVSALLGICTSTTYEGQASIELEAAITSETKEFYNYTLVQSSDGLIIGTSELIKQILQDIKISLPVGIISAKFHNTVIRFTVHVCCEIRKNTSNNEVVLSGGVFQNAYLLKNLMKELKKSSFNVYTHKEIPTNDGGIALGQLIAANEMIKTHNYI